jgi:hypothetical protein
MRPGRGLASVAIKFTTDIQAFIHCRSHEEDWIQDSTQNGQFRLRVSSQDLSYCTDTRRRDQTGFSVIGDFGTCRDQTFTPWRLRKLRSRRALSLLNAPAYSSWQLHLPQDLFFATGPPRLSQSAILLTETIKAFATIKFFY